MGKKRLIVSSIVMLIVMAFSSVPAFAGTHTLSIVGGTGGTVYGAGTYDEDEVVVIRAIANNGYYFDSWFYNGPGVIDDASKDQTTFKMPDRDASLTAIFKQGSAPTPPHKLTMTKTGNGSVSGEGDYTKGTVVTISAVPDAGWVFESWSFSGAGSVASKTSAQTTFTMPDADCTLTASFAAQSTKKYRLTMATNRYGSLYGTGDYAAGERVWVEAVADRGYSFYRWNADQGGSFSDKYSARTYFTMPASNVQISADFEEGSGGSSSSDGDYRLIVESEDGGTIRYSPNGYYYSGDRVSLTVEVKSGYTFDRWVTSDGGSFSNYTNTSTTFTMPSRRTTVTAIIKKNSSSDDNSASAGSLKLTITSPTGGGAMTGEGSYKENSTIKITAVPNTGYKFVRWEKIRGDGNIVNSYSANTEFRMGKETSTIEAYFEKATFNIKVNSNNGGSVTGPTSASPGEVVYLTANANAGFSFTSWSSSSGINFSSSTSSYTSFVMPSNDVNIVTTFTQTGSVPSSPPSVSPPTSSGTTPVAPASTTSPPTVQTQTQTQSSTKSENTGTPLPKTADTKDIIILSFTVSVLIGTLIVITVIKRRRPSN